MMLRMLSSGAVSSRVARYGRVAALLWLCALGMVRAAERDDILVKPLRLAAVPAVPVISMQGAKGSFATEAAVPGPVIVNFVFTTCSTICSTQTATLAHLQRKLHARGIKPHLLSVTIDPDNDTPQQLRKFAQQFDVGPDWQFYTGRFDDLLEIQRHFDVYRGSKAAHPPVVLMRREPGAPWVRVEGLADAARLEQVFLALPAKG